MRILLLACVVLAGSAVVAPAQCNLTSTALGGFASTSFVFTDSVLYDPDGTGPQAPRLVCTAVNTNSPTGNPLALGVAAFDEATATWSPLGTGVVQGQALHLAVLPNGELIVGGQLSSIDGVAVNHIARWNGSTWSPLGNGVPGYVRSMKVAPNGDLVVHAGTVERWNGSTWTSLGAVALGKLAFAANGDILVGTGAGIVRWDGSAWVAHAPGMDAVHNLATMPNGNLFGAGHLVGQPFDNLHFAEWNGSSWTPLGPAWGFPFGMTAISDILFLPNGDPVACGQYMFLPISPLTANVGLYRWNGATWSAFSTTSASPRTATFTPTGKLFVAFSFGLEVHQTTCPAPVVAAGNGCPGSGGANALVVEDRAWLGGTFRSRGYELPQLAIAAVVYGFAPLTLPLSAVFAQAQPGCDLLVTPDVVGLSLVAGGQVVSTMPIPSNPAVLGAVFLHQLNLYEFDVGGTLVSVTTSNALTCSVGSW